MLLINRTLAGREARQLRIAAPARVRQDDLEQSPPPEPKPTNPWGGQAEPAVDTAT